MGRGCVLCSSPRNSLAVASLPPQSQNSPDSSRPFSLQEFFFRSDIFSATPLSFQNVAFPNFTNSNPAPSTSNSPICESKSTRLYRKRWSSSTRSANNNGETAELISFDEVDEFNRFGSRDSAVQETSTSSEIDLEIPWRQFRRLKINLDLLLYKARCLARKDKDEEAEIILRQCIADWPEDGRAYMALAKILIKQEKFQGAQKLFEDGCQATSGENTYLWQAWAVLEERLGDISKARSLFDASIVADKTHAAAWHGWAILEMRNNNTRKARTLLNKGLKLCQPNEYIYQTLALLEAKAENFDQARALFAKAVQVNPKSAASWVAWARMESGRSTADAVRYLFQRGLQASPKNRYVWLAWALFEAQEGDKAKATKLFEKGIELNPKDVVLLQAFALFEHGLSRPDVAREVFKHATSVDPRHQPLWLGWGWMEWKEGQLDQARELYQRCISVNGRSADAVRTYQAWGVLEAREGNYGVARTLFKCALKLDSQNVPSWMSWALMEEERGNAIRAEELRRQCLQQKTEVVDDALWDVNLTEIIMPTLDSIRSFLRLDRGFPWSKSMEDIVSNKVLEEESDEDDAWKNGQDFNIDAFLREKFPWKYKDENQADEKPLLEKIREEARTKEN